MKIIINNNNVENNNKKEEDYVVSDITIIISIKNSISCPSGYEVVNSGCKKEGCDLNSRVGGNYIYLCQKKEKYSSLKGAQKPIKTVEILFGKNEKCSSSVLTLINEDLNKGAGGEYKYICYGYIENMLIDPIVDFFVYVKGKSSPPKEYKCETNKNLNKNCWPTTEVYLCYTTNKNLGGGSGAGNIDKTNRVITDLDIILSKKKKADSPNRYELVNEGCDSTGCDYNKPRRKYIYICQKRKKIDKLSTEKPVNSIKILFNKEEKK